MRTTVTFAEFYPVTAAASDVLDIGYDPAEARGVAEEMAAVYEVDLEASPLEAALGTLALRTKTLGDTLLGDRLVRDKLGGTASAVEVVQDWVTRSGLLTPVRRLYTAEAPLPDDYFLAVMTGTKRDELKQRRDGLLGLADTGAAIGRVLLVARDVPLEVGDTPDAWVELATEADIMGREVSPSLVLSGLRLEPLTVAAGPTADNLMVRAAVKTTDLTNFSGERVVVVASNTGRWVANAGHFLRAMQGCTHGKFNNRHDLLAVVTNFPETAADTTLAVSGANMGDMTRQIAASALEFAWHAARST